MAIWQPNVHIYIYIHITCVCIYIYVYTYLYRGGGAGGSRGRRRNLQSLSCRYMHILSFLHTNGWGWGDVNVHCIASSLHCVIRRYCYVEDRCCIQMGGGGMLTFIAFCHQKMLLRWRSVLHTDAGWGLGGCYCSLHCVIRRCCCVEDVVTFKVMLTWRCCYVWRCCTGLCT